MKIIINSYYETKDRLDERDITTRISPGSTMDPASWNVLYDALLELELPFVVNLEIYTHDVAAIVTARNAQEAELILSVVVRKVLEQMTEHGFVLTGDKKRSFSYQGTEQKQRIWQ